METDAAESGLTQRRRLPVSTYRLQFHRGFTFQAARAVVTYLARLGITDCYSSPYLRANPGSTHGYDICDHNQLNPEIGSEADYAAFTDALAAHGMGQLVDFVPNHMGVNPASNLWWRDVLENGRCSRFAPFFDIDWHPVKTELHEKVLLPILGDQYGLVLQRGELRLAFADGTFSLHYFDHDLPINPRPAAGVLRHRLEALHAELGDGDPHLRELLSIITELDHLPLYTETDPQRVIERHREKEVACERLARLVESAPRIRRHVDENVRIFNGRAGEPASFDRLHDLLEVQAYRLSYWRTASHEINYRRFFDINELAGLRMEDPEVFTATHALLLRLVREGRVTGLRLDHIDGLFDPAGYLERLQRTVAAELTRGAQPATPAPANGRLYVVAEKILSAGETLPENWPIDGTSGYDFLNDLNGLFVDPNSLRPLRRIYGRFTGSRRPFSDIAYASKKLIMLTAMASELNVLAHAFNRASETDRCTRDFTLNSLREALQEVVASFPVYRTYVTARGWTQTDQQIIETAIRRARQRNPTTEPSIFDFIRAVLLPDRPPAGSAADQQSRFDFAMKFQQYTAPVQAKGVEDTAFYRYNLLLSLNEVGGDPRRVGRTPDEFHAANLRRQRQWPATLLATATHDTKRGEDTRARLNALSELAEEWGRHVSRWARVNARNRTMVDGRPAPDRNDEYLFYQTLLGVWPAADAHFDALLLDRLRAYMLKAIREAKVHTTWVTENRAYESAVTRFVEQTLTGATAERFFDSFLPFQRRIARLGMVNSLSQLVLKITAPGVPDFYQGTELWDLSLVDPDNRQPVDYAARQRMIEELDDVLRPGADAAQRCAAVRALLTHWEDGHIKLFITACGLRLRRRLPDVFLYGAYVSLVAVGERSAHVVALARQHDGHAVLAVAPRLVSALTDAERFLPVGSPSWGATAIPLPQELAHSAYANAVTGEVVRPVPSADGASLALAEILRTSPVAILCSKPD